MNRIIEEISSVFSLLLGEDNYLMVGILFVSMMVIGIFIILLLILGIKLIQYGINSYKRRLLDKK